jgi:hypothetical protein
MRLAGFFFFFSSFLITCLLPPVRRRMRMVCFLRQLSVTSSGNGLEMGLKYY